MFPSKKNTNSLDSTKKEWFIIVDNHQEGPYTLLDLKKDWRFSPDTLVWRKGFIEWVPARRVPELKQVFKDDPEGKPLHDPTTTGPLGPDLSQEQATLAMQQDPYQLFLWMIVFLLILFYTIYQLRS